MPESSRNKPVHGRFRHWLKNLANQVKHKSLFVAPLRRCVRLSLALILYAAEAYFHCTGFSGKMDGVVVELIDVTHRPRAGASKLALTGKASFAFPISSQSTL
ncbi:MAG: hypothetical protein NTX45_24485 [Proteobacteria bacterium]|nr:hypothetical protein [Pseudomonadota bacterium]